MEPVYIVVALVAAFASLLTFFSGFGLGTILLPAFAFFFPLDVSVALTAIVHLSNNLFKFVLMRKHTNWKVVLAFGIPGILMAILGAHLLTLLGGLQEPLYKWQLGEREFTVSYLGAIMGCLLIFFAFFELWSPKKSEGKSHLVLGGAISGFFGGLSGHQGALRSVFLLRQGLSRDTFIASGIAIACIVDLGRITVYSVEMGDRLAGANVSVLLVAVLAAFAGAMLGKRFLKKVTIRTIQLSVASLLVIVGLAMVLGFIGHSG
ncbi:MAG TPA: hypothetical protein DEA96_11815 [Leptospiraceae bacterium]|nr:hypothetical protein [Spirochaetaceae bacterium]HBS05646.1 hypothetical protein [Leptospiraceae bacterium]